ncbi:MAG: hypothetical protein GC159_23110 [Phycisphaera sp.]|nr:hypothetical protein [Phycisphaera sp.]
MASIEFGILDDTSTVTLMPKFRVDLDEDEFREISTCLEAITRKTGIEFDQYSSATLEGQSLAIAIDELSGAVEHLPECAKDVLRVARHAQSINRPLQFRGL